ncbi:hypothetical protein [Haloarcula montana]|uniref:hypothetical protein n=1 Tax=Haloarcula montana TaxID=3111776 RepID=UPI002D788CAC|nr:hypothetical protein [Haloarcula sp. GH36]
MLATTTTARPRSVTDPPRNHPATATVLPNRLARSGSLWSPLAALVPRVALGRDGT